MTRHGEKTSREVPGIILVGAGQAGRVVAGLPLLDRLVIALRRAGCSEVTIVTSEDLPKLPRSEAWGIEVRRVDERPSLEGASLVVSADVIVQAHDLQRVRMTGGRLLDAEGGRLPVGVIRAWAEAGEFPGCPDVSAEKIACWVRTDVEARVAGERLWNSLTSASDGLVDRYFNRPVGRPLSRWLARTWVTPNQISLASILLGVAAGTMFGVGHFLWTIAAAVLFQVSAVLDCVDGDVARIVYKESPLGKWLDLVGDQVVHVSVFAGIAVGLYRSGASAPVVWLGTAAVMGALLSFVMVLRGTRSGGTGGGGRWLQRMLDSATNRDFSVLVLLLACLNRLEIFLWLAAIGSHVFWLLLGVLQFVDSKSARGDT